MWGPIAHSLGFFNEISRMAFLNATAFEFNNVIPDTFMLCRYKLSFNQETRVCYVNPVSNHNWKRKMVLFR